MTSAWRQDDVIVFYLQQPDCRPTRVDPTRSWPEFWPDRAQPFSDSFSGVSPPRSMAGAPPVRLAPFSRLHAHFSISSNSSNLPWLPPPFSPSRHASGTLATVICRGWSAAVVQPRHTRDRNPPKLPRFSCRFRQTAKSLDRGSPSLGRFGRNSLSFWTKLLPYFGPINTSLHLWREERRRHKKGTKITLQREETLLLTKTPSFLNSYPIQETLDTNLWSFLVLGRKKIEGAWKRRGAKGRRGSSQL